jgi:hypothetical protein
MSDSDLEPTDMFDAECATVRLSLFAERPDNPRIAVMDLPAKGSQRRYLPGHAEQHI